MSDEIQAWNPALPRVIDGKRLILKVLDPSHAEAYFERIQADREYLLQWLPWPVHIREVGDQLSYIQNTAADFEAGRLFGYGIFHAESHEILGHISAFAISRAHRRAEIGYWLVQGQQGRGYATEAVGLLQSTLFAAGFHRLEIRCDVQNSGSAAIPKRLGYQLDGQLRQQQWRGDRFVDIFVFSRLAID